MRPALPVLAALLALLPILAAAPARAQVTAEGVWAATEAYWEVWGVDVTGTPARDGATLTVGGIAALGALPFGTGELHVAAPDLVLTERGDGTVLVETANPAVSQVALTLRLPGREFTATAPVSLAWEGREMVASGTPEAVTFTLRSGRVDVAAGPVEVAGGPDAPAPPGGPVLLSLRAGLASADIVTTVRPAATPGGLVGIDAAIAYGELVTDLALSVPGALDMRGAGRTAASTTSAAMRLPAGGVGVTQVAAALRAGLSVALDLRATGSESLTLAYRPATAPSEDWSRAARSAARLTLDAGGLAVSGEAQGVEGRMSDALPAVRPGLALGYAVGATTYELALPLLAGDGQRIALTLAARDLRPDAATWAALDPAGALPRAPGSLTLSVEQALDLPFDPVAPLAWGAAGARAARGEVPLDLGLLSARVDAAGAGAWVGAEALFDFDESDLATRGGFPLPQGRATVTLQGHEALLDALVAGGLVSPFGADAVRSGIAGAFRPAANRGVDLVFEIGPGTRRVLNGRPLR